MGVGSPKVAWKCTSMDVVYKSATFSTTCKKVWTYEHHSDSFAKQKQKKKVKKWQSDKVFCKD